jgi:hypothetical protein
METNHCLNRVFTDTDSKRIYQYASMVKNFNPSIFKTKKYEFLESALMNNKYI